MVNLESHRPHQLLLVHTLIFIRTNQTCCLFTNNQNKELKHKLWMVLLRSQKNSINTFVCSQKYHICIWVHNLLQPGSRAARNGERMRKWRENDEIEKDSLSTFPHFLFISSLSVHFLYRKLSHFVAKC